jgi:hypothetical protein
MRHIKVFEKFNEIDSICRKLGIRNYTVNVDGTVDVNGDVSLNRWHPDTSIKEEKLTKMPLKFGKVSGYFSCPSNDLTTLEGSPTHVGDYFNCSANKLTSLEGGPKFVGRDFYCQYNNLVTLDGAPKEIGGYFCCGFFDTETNPIYKVYKLFPNHKAYLDSLDYGYLRGTTIDKIRFKEALDEFGIDIPESIPGYKYI